MAIDLTSVPDEELPQLFADVCEEVVSRALMEPAVLRLKEQDEGALEELYEWFEDLHPENDNVAAPDDAEVIDKSDGGE